MDGNLTERERLFVQVVTSGILVLVGLIEIRHAKKMIVEAINMLEHAGYDTTYLKPKNYYTKK